MKKIINTLLVFVLVFAMAVPAFGHGIAGDGEKAGNRLKALGVVTGDENGNMNWTNTMTREEFATVAVKVLGLATAADAAKGATQFSDVETNRWSSGVINIATQQGLINGMGNGTFAPKDPITYAQAMAIIVRLLGYEPSVTGVWPSNYVVKANSLGLLDKVKLLNQEGANGAIQRFEVFTMLDNALTVPKMVQVGYGSDVKYVVSGNGENTTKETLLANNLDLDEIDAKIIAVDSEDLEIEVREKDDKGAYSTKEKYTVVPEVALAGLENAIVTLWVKDSTVFQIENESTIIYDFISKVDGDTVAINYDNVDTIKLKNADTEYDVKQDSNDDADFDLTVDGSSVSSGNIDIDGYFAKVIVYDSEIVRVDAYNLNDASGVIASTDADYIQYLVTDTNKKLRGIEDADDLQVIIDGAAKTFADLKEGMYFEAYKNGDDFVIVASTKSVEGKLDRVNSSDSEVRIAGEYKDLAATYYLSTDLGESYTEYTSVTAASFADLFDEDVVALLNNKGEVVYVKADVEETTNKFYGFLLSVDTFSKKVRIAKDVDGELDEVVFETDFSSTEWTNIQAATSGYDVDAVLKFEINEDGEVIGFEDKITAVSKTGTEFKGSYIEAGSNEYVKDSVVVLDITDPADAQLLNWADINDTDLGVMDSVTFYSDANPAEILVITASTVSLGASDVNFGFVLDYEQVSKDNYEFKLATLDGEQTFVINKDKINNADQYDVIAYKTNGDKIETVTDDVYSNLSGVAAADPDWTAVTGAVTEDSIDGSYFNVGAAPGTLYKLANDALVYEVVDADEFEVADLSDIDDSTGNEDNVSFLVVDGVVKLLFFWE